MTAFTRAHTTTTTTAYPLLQAVGRVHRIGQQRPVTIHRLLVNNTIEEVVLSLSESRAGIWGSGVGCEGEADDAVTGLDVQAGAESRADIEGLLEALD